MSLVPVPLIALESPLLIPLYHYCRDISNPRCIEFVFQYAWFKKIKVLCFEHISITAVRHSDSFVDAQNRTSPPASPLATSCLILIPYLRLCLDHYFHLGSFCPASQEPLLLLLGSSVANFSHVPDFSVIVCANQSSVALPNRFSRSALPNYASSYTENHFCIVCD